MVDGESTNGKGCEGDFGEHDGRERREKKQMTTAPGLRLDGRKEELRGGVQRLRKPGSAPRPFYASGGALSSETNLARFQAPTHH